MSIASFFLKLESQFVLQLAVDHFGTRCIFIASELCEGGELFNAMIEDRWPDLPPGPSMDAGPQRP